MPTIESSDMAGMFYEMLTSQNPSAAGINSGRFDVASGACIRGKHLIKCQTRKDDHRPYDAYQPTK